MEKFLEKYNKTWEKVSESVKKINCKPLHNKNI